MWNSYVMIKKNRYLFQCVTADWFKKKFTLIYPGRNFIFKQLLKSYILILFSNWIGKSNYLESQSKYNALLTITAHRRSHTIYFGYGSLNATNTLKHFLIYQLVKFCPAIQSNTSNHS